MQISTFNEAKRLHDMGFAVLWLHPKSKRPIGNAWTSGPRKPWAELRREYKLGMNVGVRLGTPSKLEKGFLCAIDCDVKSKDKKHFLEMKTALKKLTKGKVLPTVTTGRGNGSRHVYCRTKDAFATFTPYRSKEIVEYMAPSKSPSKKEIEALGDKKIKKGLRLAPAWEISLYSDGRQCVLPPSVHPDSGRNYEWRVPAESVKALPLIEFALPEESADAKPEKSFAEHRPKNLEKFVFTVSDVDVSWLPISDEVKDAIITGAGVDDRSEYLLRATSALNSAGLSKDQILSVLTHPDNYLSSCAYDHAQTKKRERAAYWLWKYTVRKVLMERPGHLAFDDKPKAKPKKLTKEEQAKQNADMKSLTSWKDQLETTKQGRVESSLANLELIFGNAAKDVFVRDLFANRLVYGTKSPWNTTVGKHRKKEQLFEDIDLSIIRSWLAEKYGFEPPANLVLEVSQLIGFRKAYHPVHEYLKSLVWDGVPRISTWIRDYCQGVAAEPYLSEVSRKFLVAMVKRVFEPGCQWDYVLVLEGDQGKKKSTVARTLAGDKWFIDHLPDLRDKDAMLNLQGKWLVELGELADVKRTDYNLVKQYLIRRVDTLRSPYGKIREDLPRQSVFIGTVNEGQYLKDPTGNRRFWPVKVGMCDVKGLSEVREQLFAEAYQAYLLGEELYLKDEANDQATAAQEQRRVHDDSAEMKDRLMEFLHTEDGKRYYKERFRARDLFEGPNAPWGQWTPMGWTLNTAAQVLHAVGFKPVRRNDGRYWVAPEKMYVNELGKFIPESTESRAKKRQRENKKMWVQKAPSNLSDVTFENRKRRHSKSFY